MAEIALPLALALLGAIVGSFVATLVIRWPHGESVMRGRSRCDGCGATLGTLELVPLVSALQQRGRCKRCGVAIDPRHWWIEGACALVGAAAGLAAPAVWALFGAAFGWLLVALAALDIAELWLPDALTATLAVLGLASALAGVPPALPGRLIGGAAGFIALWLVAAGYRRVRGREGMGGGDPKLFGAIGLWLGWSLLPAVLLLAALTGLALVAVRAASGRTIAGSDMLPLGAMLAITAYPAWLVLIGWGG